MATSRDIEQLKEKIYTLVSSTNDFATLQIIEGLLDEGGLKQESGGDSPNGWFRRFNHPQERNSAVASPVLFQEQMSHESQPKKPDSDERQGNYGGSSTGNFERKSVKPSSPIETPIGGGGEQEQAEPENEAKNDDDEMLKSSINGCFDDIDEAQEPNARDYEREKNGEQQAKFTIGKSVQESDAGTPEREEDRKQPRSPVDDATQCSETQDTGSDEGKEHEEEPKTSIPESASSVFGVGEQVSAAESYEKKDEKAPKSLIEAPSTGDFSEGREETVKHVEREESEKKPLPVEEESGSGNGHQAASHLFFNSSTKPHNPVPATKHVLASGTVQSSLPVSPVPCSTGVIAQPTAEHTPDSALANGVSLGSATGMLNADPPVEAEQEGLNLSTKKKKKRPNYEIENKELTRQVTELKSELEKSRKQLHERNTQVTELKSELETSRKQLHERNTWVSELEKRVANYEKEINVLEMKIEQLEELMKGASCMMCRYPAFAKERSGKRVGYALLLINTFSDGPRDLQELKRAKLDAIILESILKNMGFKVKLMFDTTEEEMYRALSEVEEELEDNDQIVLVYISTHGGLSVSGEKDSSDEESGDDEKQPKKKHPKSIGEFIRDKNGHKIFDLEGVLDKYLGNCRGKLKLICVDACRGEKCHRPNDTLPNNRIILRSCMSGYASHWCSYGSPMNIAFCGELLGAHRSDGIFTILQRVIARVSEQMLCYRNEDGKSVEVKQLPEMKSTDVQHKRRMRRRNSWHGSTDVSCFKSMCII